MVYIFSMIATIFTNWYNTEILYCLSCIFKAATIHHSISNQNCNPACFNSVKRDNCFYCYSEVVSNTIQYFKQNLKYWFTSKLLRNQKKSEHILGTLKQCSVIAILIKAKKKITNSQLKTFFSQFIIFFLAYLLVHLDSWVMSNHFLQSKSQDSLSVEDVFYLWLHNLSPVKIEK